MSNSETTKAIASWLQKQPASVELRAWAEKLLLDLCAIDTSLGDVDRLRESERKSYEVFLTSASRYVYGDSRLISIPETLRDDPYYTAPYYAVDGIFPDAVYKDRSNFYLRSRTEKRGHRWLLNAHVDTVPPHIPPSQPKSGMAHGRGTADDKGGMVVAALAGRFLQDLKHAGLADPPPVDFLFSIDEEMGGNGSLAAAIELDLRQTSVIVLEPTKLRPHPASWGAIWFEARAQTPISANSEQQRAALLPAMAAAVREMSAASRQLQNESIHPLFSQQDAQGCFGILGPYGNHPATSCGTFAFLMDLPATDAQQVHRIVVDALSTAVKAGRIKDASAQPVVTAFETPARSRLEQGQGRPRRTWKVAVTSIQAHMGSRERDSDAILKMAEVEAALTAHGATGVRLPTPVWGLTMEGGLGFLPTHSMEDVKARMTDAFQKGVAEALKSAGIPASQVEAWIRYDKLHNAAYTSAPNAIGAKALADASEVLRGVREPLVGWQVSCDARIFARTCPDVTTFGAGSLDTAHGPKEFVTMDDIMTAAQMVVLAILTAEAP